jgi:intracellular sulfur oxidation DsrE/DsrF family protein
MRKIVAVVTRDGLGHVGTADRQFGLDMLDRFLHALESQTVKPHAICFYTDGVKVVCKGSPVFLSLKLLEGMGVRLVACKTCLERFGLVEMVAVGEVGTMNAIVTLMTEADSVMTI